MAKRSYEEWKRLMDAECVSICGMDSECFPDVPLVDWWQQGVSPKAAAKRVIRNAGN